jgi:Holliday junction resolvase RusA-like endonuclease
MEPTQGHDQLSLEDIQVLPNNSNASFKLLILGKPVAWKRPEFISGINRRTGNFYRNVTVNKDLKTKTEQFCQLVERQLQGQPRPCIADKRICLKIWFCTKPSLSFFINGDGIRLKPQYNRFTIAGHSPFCKIEKPDVDNLVKFVLDALKGICWADDYQVSVITAYKCVDLYPPFQGRTIIEFHALMSQTDLCPIPEWGKNNEQP